MIPTMGQATRNALLVLLLSTPLWSSAVLVLEGTFLCTSPMLVQTGNLDPSLHFQSYRCGALSLPQVCAQPVTLVPSVPPVSIPLLWQRKVWLLVRAVEQVHMALALVLLLLVIVHPVLLACIPLPQLQLLQLHV